MNFWAQQQQYYVAEQHGKVEDYIIGVDSVVYSLHLKHEYIIKQNKRIKQRNAHNTIPFLF